MPLDLINFLVPIFFYLGDGERTKKSCHLVPNKLVHVCFNSFNANDKNLCFDPRHFFSKLQIRAFCEHWLKQQLALRKKLKQTNHYLFGILNRSNSHQNYKPNYKSKSFGGHDSPFSVTKPAYLNLFLFYVNVVILKTMIQVKGTWIP